MTVFYFTGTGNSLAVAKRIGGTLISIPQVINSDNRYYKDDVIGVVYPVYWATAPDMVLEFLVKAKFECDYSFIISTSGGMNGSSLIEAKRVFRQNGYKFDYMDDATTIDNSMSVGSIETQKAKKKDSNFALKVEEIANNISERKQNNDKKAGAIIRIFSSVIRKMPNYEKMSQKLSVDDKCNHCKVCMNVCPAGNIEVNDKVHFGKRCTGCLACVHNCPQNATHFKWERGSSRWRNPDVSLNEIINANNRMV